MIWDVFFGLFAAACARSFPPLKYVDEYDGVLCERCGDSGFSGRGTGYDAVCGDCGGQAATAVDRCDALRALWLALGGEPVSTRPARGARGG